MSTSILFKDKKPNSLFLDQLYDPDIDGPYPEGDESYPRLIPQEGATVIDRESGLLYYAYYVDPETYKTTLKPTKIIVTSDDDANIVSIVSYGNDKYMLYYVNDTVPTKLIIDSKLILYGNSLTEYQLIRTNSKGEKEVLSLYLDSDEVVKGNRVPLSNVSNMIGAKQCTNCHTYSEMKEGDTVELYCYDNVGILSAQITLFTRKGARLNDLLSDSSIIVNMDAVSLQMLGSDFYIYQRQDPSHLGITPRLEYNDGSLMDIEIDNKSCFLYGLEDFTPSFPGQQQKILIKKYLGYKEFSKNATILDGQRYITCEKMITVLANKSIDGIKISVMPIWNPNTEEYVFRYVAYSDRRDKVIDVTKDVKLRTPFDFGKFYQTQQLQMYVDLKDVFSSDSSVPYMQNEFIGLRPYNEFVRYTISDSKDLDIVYGSDNPYCRRPVIFYDEDLERYFIPTSRFGNVEAFLEAFYENANPPYNTVNETKAPTPTHFTIRALDDLTVLITTPIPIERYNQLWNINRMGNSNMLVGANVIVEFLMEIGNTYMILYGVPVDVYDGRDKSYNTEDNDIV